MEVILFISAYMNFFLLPTKKMILGFSHMASMKTKLEKMNYLLAVENVRKYKFIWKYLKKMYFSFRKFVN